MEKRAFRKKNLQIYDQLQTSINFLVEAWKKHGPIALVLLLMKREPTRFLWRPVITFSCLQVFEISSFWENRTDFMTYPFNLSRILRKLVQGAILFCISQDCIIVCAMQWTKIDKKTYTLWNRFNINLFFHSFLCKITPWLFGNRNLFSRSCWSWVLIHSLESTLFSTGFSGFLPLKTSSPIQLTKNQVMTSRY